MEVVGGDQGRLVAGERASLRFGKEGGVSEDAIIVDINDVPKRRLSIRTIRDACP